MSPIESPCILVCSIDMKTGYCFGCGRTREELRAVWGGVGGEVMFDRLRGVDARLTRWLTTASLVVLAALGVQLILRGVSGLSG